MNQTAMVNAAAAAVKHLPLPDRLRAAGAGAAARAGFGSRLGGRAGAFVGGSAGLALALTLER